MKLIFEKGAPGQRLSLLPPCDVPEITLSRPRTEPPPSPSPAPPPWTCPMCRRRS